MRVDKFTITYIDDVVISMYLGRIMKKLFVVIVGVFLVLSNSQIIYAKCTKEVTKGKVVKNEVISAGETQIVWYGGQTENVTVEKGGRQLVYLGGKTTGTTINPFGFQYVGQSGLANGTIVKEKGFQLVRGVSINTVISGGVQAVTGNVVYTKVEKGGIQFIDWTAEITDTTVIDDGIQHVDLGASGSTEKVKLNKGGVQNIYSATPLTGSPPKGVIEKDTIEIGK